MTMPYPLYRFCLKVRLVWNSNRAVQVLVVVLVVAFLLRLAWINSEIDRMQQLGIYGHP